MEWQAIVLVMQILMLAVGWFLFQQARGELSARAAETPVLGEVKALQRSIKQMLADLETTSDRSSLHLETKCEEARQLLYALNTTLNEINSKQDQIFLTTVSENASCDNVNLFLNSGETAQVSSNENPENTVTRPDALKMSHSPREISREKVFSLADAGQASAIIARETGLAEGEIEMLLGLRLQRA